VSVTGWCTVSSTSLGATPACSARLASPAGGAHGLVRGSFVPPEPIRLEKLLEDARIKLSSVANDISGVSGRLMLDALIAVERDPNELADLAKRRLRSKIPALTEALTGRFGDHHAFLARMHLDLIDQRSTAIAEITARIEVVIEPFCGARDLICSIPGVSALVADVIIAETGADMSRFPTPGHLASWAGTCPGSNESASRIKSTKTRPGNHYLKGALGISAMSAAGGKDTYLADTAVVTARLPGRSSVDAQAPQYAAVPEARHAQAMSW